MSDDIRKNLRSRSATYAALTRSHAPNDPVLVDARRALEIARNSARIDALIAAATPLTDEQRTRLAELLKPVRLGGATG